MPLDDEIKIHVFDGRDYKAWKKRILMYLKCKKFYEPATRKKMDTDAKDNWNEKNQWAMNYIYCSITNEQLEFVGDQDTAYIIMKKFDEMYMKESTALQPCIRRRLGMMRLKDFEESSTFFTEFEKTINELKVAGANVSEREKVDYMLKTLPESLIYVGDLIDSLKKGDRTCEFLKNKITMWETRCETKRSNAFKVEKRDIKCHDCEKYGHVVRNCTNTCRGRNNDGNNGGAQWQGSAYQPQQNRGCGGRASGQRGRGYGQRGFGQQGRSRG